MNLSLQIGGIIILMMVFSLYITQKRLKIQNSRTFLLLLGFTAMNLCCHTAILIAMGGPTEYENIVEIGEKIYSLSGVGLSLCFFIYFVDDFFAKRYQRHRVFLACNFFFAVAAVLTFVSQDAVVIVGNSLQLSPSFVTFGYTLPCIIAAALAVILLVNRQKVRKDRLVTLVTWYVLWIGGVVAQGFFPNLRAVSFMNTLGVLLIYIKLENPDNYIDKASGMFNTTAFSEFTREMIKRGASLHIVCIEIDQRTIDLVPIGKRPEVQEKLVSVYEATPKCEKFRFLDNITIFVFFDQSDTAEGYNFLQDAFDKAWDSDGEVFMSPIWIGIPLPETGLRVDEILHTIFYARKNVGKDRHILVNQEYIDKMNRVTETSNLVASALEEDRVEVFYQPIYSAAEGRIVSAEALVRIRNRDGSLTYPGDFIEVAEKSGQIIKLGERVFEKVCEFLADKENDRFNLNYIEINLSIVQCGYIFLANSFMEIMRRYKVDPRRINLEITESASLSDRDTLLRNMDILRECGVRFSLDDFGTGQSNLNYIVDMPVDIVKFDREMTWSYFENSKARYVMEMSVQMIHGMELKVVTEGVENEQQFSQLRRLGVDYVQGYFFSKPVSKADFVDFLCKNLNMDVNIN